MRLPKRSKIEKCAGKDETRLTLTRLHLRILGEGKEREGVLEACDSYKLVQIPVELDEGDTEGTIPVEAVTQGRKAAGRNPQMPVILADEEKVHVAGNGADITFERPRDGQDYPKTQQLFPDDEQLGDFEIAVNAKYLYEMAQAYGDDVVQLRFTKGGANGDISPLRPIIVTPNAPKPEFDGARGLLMPVRIKDSK